MSEHQDVKSKDIEWLCNYKTIIYIYFPLFFAFILVLANYNLGADYNWDLLNYHYLNGFLFLHGRTFSDSIATHNSYFNPIQDIFYYLIIHNFTPIWVNFILSIIQSLCAYLVFIIAFYSLPIKNTLIKIISATSIALLVVIAPIFWSEIGGTMGDTTLSIPILLSILFLSLSFSININYLKVFSFLAGLCIGLSSGLKLTNCVELIGFYLAFFVCLFINQLTQRKIRLSTTIYRITFTLLGSVIMFFIIYAPIGIPLMLRYKNPFFPYFNNIFHSPYVQAVSSQDPRWLIQPKQFLLVPFMMIFRNPECLGWKGMEINFSYYDIAIFEIIFPIWIFMKFTSQSLLSINKNSFFSLFIPFYLAFSFLIWCFVFGYYRYLAPLEMLFPLSLVLMISDIFRNDFKMTIFALFAVIILSLLSFPLNTWGRIKPFPKIYFGITFSDFTKFNNSIIITGDTPEGFALPYFPSNCHFLGYPPKLALTEIFSKEYYSKINNWKGNYYLLTLEAPSEQLLNYIQLDLHLYCGKKSDTEVIKTHNMKLYMTKLYPTKTDGNMLDQSLKH